MRDEIRDYQTEKERAESNARFRGALRLAMGVVLIIYLGLAFSLTRVKSGEAEYYISFFTLGLNTLLFAAVLAASVVMKRRYERCVLRMKELERADKPDPWRIDS